MRSSKEFLQTGHGGQAPAFHPMLTKGFFPKQDPSGAFVVRPVSLSQVWHSQTWSRIISEWAKGSFSHNANDPGKKSEIFWQIEGKHFLTLSKQNQCTKVQARSKDVLQVQLWLAQWLTPEQGQISKSKWMMYTFLKMCFLILMHRRTPLQRFCSACFAK